MTEIQRLEAELANRQAKLERLKKELVAAEKKNDQDSIDKAQKKLDKEEELLDVVKDRLKVEQSIQKSINSQLSTFTRLNRGTKERLAGDEKTATFYKQILVSTGKLKAEQQLLIEQNGESNDILDTRLDYYSDISSEILRQAKENEVLEEKLKGQSDFERERLELSATYNSLREELNREIQNELESNGKILSLEEIKAGKGGEELKQKALLIDKMKEEEENLLELLSLKEKQILYGQRLEEIQQNQADLAEMVPESMKGAFDFAQKLGGALKAGGPSLLAFTALVALLGAVVSSFTKLDEAAEGFRQETGLTVSQTKEINKDVNNIVANFAQLGVDAEQVFGVVSALKGEFADISGFSEETLGALTVLGANFGVAADSAAKTQAILENIGGLSSETAASVQLQVVNMAKMAGVAPAKVIEDIAENAEIASTFFKGDVNALAKAAVEARRLGTNIARTAEIAEGLLDFESGISEELATAAMLGGDFNLARARALAFEGKTVEAQREILSQIQKTGDFRQKDYFTQQQIAKATGMSVEEINKQLSIQEKLSSLSTDERKKAEQAIANGLDITNINEDQLALEVERAAKQKEIQGSLTNIKNTFDGLISSVGSTFLPIIQAVASVFEFISSSAAGIVGFLGTMAVILGTIYAIKVKNFILSQKEAFLEARKAGSTIVGAVASIFGGQGKLPIIGAIIAATMVGGLFAAIAKARATPVGDLKIDPNGGPIVASPTEGGIFQGTKNDALAMGPAENIGLGGGNLSAPLSAVVNEIRGLREDMANGKIRVFMDGKKVTAGITKVVTTSGQNSYVRA